MMYSKMMYIKKDDFLSSSYNKDQYLWIYTHNGLLQDCTSKFKSHTQEQV